MQKHHCLAKRQVRVGKDGPLGHCTVGIALPTVPVQVGPILPVPKTQGPSVPAALPRPFDQADLHGLLGALEVVVKVRLAKEAHLAPNTWQIPLRPLSCFVICFVVCLCFFVVYLFFCLNRCFFSVVAVVVGVSG